MQHEENTVACIHGRPEYSLNFLQFCQNLSGWHADETAWAQEQSGTEHSVFHRSCAGFTNCGSPCKRAS